MDKYLPKIFGYITDSFPRTRSLLAGYVFILVAALLVDSSLSTFIPNNNNRLFTYLGIAIIWSLIIFYARNFRLPNNNKRIGIVLAIRTENDKQKIRVRNDFAKVLKEQFKLTTLSADADVFVLDNFYAEKISNTLTKYVEKIEEIKSSGKLPDKVPSIVKRWQKLQKRMKGTFYIYGEIKERLNEENTYFLDLDAMATHKPFAGPAHQVMTKDLQALWFKRIQFQEKLEFLGFSFSAELVLVGAKYILGMSALQSGHAELALHLHEGLIKDFDKFKPLPKEIAEIKHRILQMIPHEYYLAGKQSFEQNELNKSLEQVEHSLALNVKLYDSYILLSLLKFQLTSNPQQAFDVVEKGKYYAGSDGTWKYNRAFLLLELDRFDEAIQQYDDISSSSYPTEQEIINQVIEFNEDLISHNNKLISPEFVLGFIKFKKIQNYPEALQHFEKTIEKCVEPKYEPIKKYAENAVIELKNYMGLT